MARYSMLSTFLENLLLLRGWRIIQNYYNNLRNDRVLNPKSIDRNLIHDLLEY